MDVKFVEIGERLSRKEKDAIACELADKCNVEMHTIGLWLRGKRFPRPRSREIITEVLKERDFIANDDVLIY